MKDVSITLIEMIPFDIMVQILEKDCKKYLESPSEELKSKIIMGCNSIALKQACEKEGGSEKLIEKMDELERAQKFFTPSKQ